MGGGSWLSGSCVREEVMGGPVRQRQETAACEVEEYLNGGLRGSGCSGPLRSSDPHHDCSSQSLPLEGSGDAVQEGGQVKFLGGDFGP